MRCRHGPSSLATRTGASSPSPQSFLGFLCTCPRNPPRTFGKALVRTLEPGHICTSCVESFCTVFHLHSQRDILQCRWLYTPPCSLVCTPLYMRCSSLVFRASCSFSQTCNQSPRPRMQHSTDTPSQA